jgi:hypothetical protein
LLIACDIKLPGSEDGATDDDWSTWEDDSGFAETPSPLDGDGTSDDSGGAANADADADDGDGGDADGGDADGGDADGGDGDGGDGDGGDGDGGDGDGGDADGGDADGAHGMPPTAVCEVSPDSIVPIVGSADWIGSESYDPFGLPLTYNWTLEEFPEGATTVMPSGSPTASDRNDFSPDVAGEYIGQLVVTNSLGIASEPCQATLNAIPDENLWVEMFWEHSGDDMDLHLLAPGGSIGTETDCYYGNCTDSDWGGGLDWGIPGSSLDDPVLDLDDISETGPENINIEEPESGIFTVVVHDYPGSVYDAGNPVTVNIYLDGSLEWTDTRVISVEDSYTEFALIDTATGEVTSL